MLGLGSSAAYSVLHHCFFALVEASQIAQSIANNTSNFIDNISVSIKVFLRLVFKLSVYINHFQRMSFCYISKLYFEMLRENCLPFKFPQRL